VGGGLGVRVETDGERFTDAHVSGTLFRGYENIITGRDPRDCMAFSSRSCGWCGGVHQTTSSLALEMAWDLSPTPMAVALRSIAQATEAIWVHAAHLAVRAGPDYCASVVKDTTPWLWDAALSAEAPRAEVHGYDTISEIMEAMTPVSGRYWWETIPAGRRVLEMINLVYGKYPHPSVLSPGGVGSTLTVGNFTEYYTRLYRSVDYVKKVVAIWDDLIDFLLDSDPRWASVGERPANFIHAGAWHLDSYDPSYSALEADGSGRLAAPGIILNGEVVTNSLREVNHGIEESVDHAFYGSWTGGGLDPAGSQLPSRHPWTKATIPAPEAFDPASRYSWCTAPRWRDQVVETTPLGRLWLTAMRSDFPPNDFIEPTGTGVRILVPKNFLPETTVEWRIPDRVNALERLRADAYGIAFAGLSAALALLKGFELTRTGETAVSRPIKAPPEEASGVGLWDSGRGMNAHWITVAGGRVETYQIVGPSTWNCSPRDAADRPGPMEEALIGSPVIEEPANGHLRGIDALRVIHSFDPCMNCAVH
jgi:hydrogenase large subunit